MKLTISAIVLSMALVTLPSFADTLLNDGHYIGKGNWQAAGGEEGTYAVETTAEDGQITDVYTYSLGGETKTFVYTIRPSEDQFFDILTDGQKVGEGYCMSVQCHYTLSFGENSIEATSTYWQNHIYRLGSKTTEDGFVVTWEEALEKQ